MNNCKDKIKYIEITDALDSLERYKTRILFSNMSVYRCGKHRCWHLGHNRKMSSSDIVNNTLENFDSLQLI